MLLCMCFLLFCLLIAMCRSPTKLKHFYSLKCVLSEEDAVMCSSTSKLLQFIDIQVTMILIVTSLEHRSSMPFAGTLRFGCGAASSDICVMHAIRHEISGWKSVTFYSPIDLSYCH